MKRLLGLLLVMGMVGCGGKENAGNAVDPSIGADEQLVTESGGEKSDPSNPNVKVDEPPVQAVDTPPAGEAALPATPKNEPHAKVDEPPVQAVGTNPSVASESVSPKTPADTVDDTPVQQAVDFSKLVERDGLWYEGDSETPFTGVAVVRYENGQKEAEATLKDGKPEGLMTAWFENGQKNQEITYKDGKPEGLATRWYKNGKKMVEAAYKDGKEDGPSTTWHENGQKWSEVTYKDGKREGLATWWHGNGQKQAERTFKDGKKVSEKKWDPAGNEIKD